MTATAIDPVCGMTVDPATAAASAEVNGQTYYFCAVGCRKAFLDDPESYLRDAERHSHHEHHGHHH